MGNWVFLVDKRDTEALAFAFSGVPDVVLGACLDVAGALAFNGVPVVGVINAGLGSADPVANFGVPSVHNTVFRVRSFESADAFFQYLVVVVIFWANFDVPEFAGV